MTLTPTEESTTMVTCLSCETNKATRVWTDEHNGACAMCEECWDGSVDREQSEAR